MARGTVVVCCDGRVDSERVSLVAADPGDARTATGDVSSDLCAAAVVPGGDSTASADVRAAVGDVGGVQVALWQPQAASVPRPGALAY